MATTIPFPKKTKRFETPFNAEDHDPKLADALWRWLEELEEKKAAFPINGERRAPEPHLVKAPFPPYYQKGNWKDGVWKRDSYGDDHLHADADVLMAELVRGEDIGIIPYRLGCLVVDIDTGKGKPALEESADFVFQLLGEPIVEYETPSGGVHRWFRTAAPLRRHDLFLEGRHFGELLCDHSYAVAWKLQHLWGGLKAGWQNADALRKRDVQILWESKDEGNDTSSETKLTPATAPEGHRDTTLFKKACRVLETSKTKRDAVDAAIELCLEAKANKKPLRDSQIKTCLGSAAKRVLGEATESGVKDTVGSDYEPKDWEFLWYAWLPIRHLTILGGDGGTGKGTLIARLAASVAGKRPWPDGSYSEPGRIVLVGNEDDYERTIRKRYDAAGCPPDRWIHRELPNVARPYEEFLSKKLPDDVRLVVVDPLIQNMSDDANNTTKARKWAEGWNHVASELGCAVLGVMHNVKFAGEKVKGGKVGDVIAGSAQWLNTARSGWLLVKDEDDPKAPRLLHLGKKNCDEIPTSYTYKVTGELNTRGVMRVTQFDERVNGASEVRAIIQRQTEAPWLQDGDDALAELEALGMFDKDGKPFPTIEGYTVICKSTDWHSLIPEEWGNSKKARYRTKRNIETKRSGTVWYMCHASK